MSGHAPANQLELGFELLDRVKPDRGARSGETLIGGERIEHPPSARLNVPNRRMRTRMYGGVAGESG